MGDINNLIICSLIFLLVYVVVKPYFKFCCQYLKTKSFKKECCFVLIIKCWKIISYRNYWNGIWINNYFLRLNGQEEIIDKIFNKDYQKQLSN